MAEELTVMPDEAIPQPVPPDAPAAPPEEFAEPTAPPALEPLPSGPQPPLKALVEGLLFASDEPLTVAKMKEVLGVEPARIREAIEALTADYDAQERAFGIQAIAGGYVLATRPAFHPWVSRLQKARNEGRLSPAALETLAVIAYRQPVNRVNIEAIRGVQAGPLIRALMDKDLVRVAGKEDLPGHPVLYGTTPRFLEILGLNSISDLPRPEELK